MQFITLNSGYQMPVLGLGTYILTPDQAEQSVITALQNGYRLIDTANVYMNERGVGRGLKKSGVAREEVFLTTKLWPSEYNNVASAIDDTLARLGTDYLDLLLLHQSVGDYIAGYQGMEEAVRAGKVHSIGLSNFYQDKFAQVVAASSIKPAVLQNENHPFWQNRELKDFIAQQGTVLESWFPLGGRDNTQDLFNHPIIQEIARQQQRTPAQVILRWHVQAGYIAIPGSDNSQDIIENINIFDFTLTPQQLEQLAALDGTARFFTMSPAEQEQAFTAFAPDFNAQK